VTAASALALVRHGETVGNSSVRYYGRTDVELSELGRAQMRATARALALEFGFSRFAHVFASPLHRASEGARIIAGSAAEIIAIEEFREVDFGAFEGLTASEIADCFPEFRRWNHDRLAPDYTYPGGESRAAFAARVGRGMARMLSPRRPGALLLVAHRGVIRTITQTLTGAEPIIELGSIQILSCAEGGHWANERLDFTAHLGEPGCG
jgi:broad specificity phosphatase PhoE